MGLDQIEGKHKCPSAMLLLRAEDEIPSVWTDAWDMIDTEEEARLTELEEQRKGLQAQAAELVENFTRVIPPKKTRGRGFFARNHTGGTGAEATVETIDNLVANTTEVTQGFVGWVTGMGGIFESIYTRARALQDEDEVAVEKMAELLKLAIIVTKDISGFFKDLREWYCFVNGALKQWKTSAKTTNQQLARGTKKALKDLQHIRKQTHDSIKKKLQQAMEWDIRINAKVIETCGMVLNAFIGEAKDSEEASEGDEESNGDDEGYEGADDGAADAESGDDSDSDFMSDMKSYCFRKFGKVAEDKVNKRAKIYDKVQIHLMCEYGECHVPEGIPIL
jgi:hypothetical protein